MSEPRRIVGTENAVRVDAQVTGEDVSPGAKIPVTYEITNGRPDAIAIADLLPDTSYDAESNTFTITIGSEVPGNTMVPRLIEIAAGEKKSFTTLARIVSMMMPRPLDAAGTLAQASFRLKVNFLGRVEPFRALIGISENAVADQELADRLFPLWLQHNEAVYTNTIPMRWKARTRESSPAEIRGLRRRGL